MPYPVSERKEFPLATLPRIHIVGRKNSGKTTLIVDLIQYFTAQGLRVGTVKHTHHRHELDTPGKDSHRHREAGASAVGILSPALNAVFWSGHAGEDIADRYWQFTQLMADCDVVLVEGHASAPGPKIEVWRREIAEAPLAESDPSIVATITDDPVPLAVPRWPRNDVPFVAQQILKFAASVSPKQLEL